MTFMSITYAGFAFFRPILYYYRTLPLERLRASGILRKYGRSSLDFFKLWSDKSYYFNDEGNCFIAYRAGNNYAIALSDPVGPEEEVEETVRGFIEFCHANDWGVAFHQVPQDFLAIYERVGLKHLKIGDEAIVHLTSFDLEGSERKSLRKTVKRFELKASQCASISLLFPMRSCCRQSQYQTTGSICQDGVNASSPWVSSMKATYAQRRFMWWLMRRAK